MAAFKNAHVPFTPSDVPQMLKKGRKIMACRNDLHKIIMHLLQRFSTDYPKEILRFVVLTAPKPVSKEDMIRGLRLFSGPVEIAVVFGSAAYELCTLEPVALAPLKWLYRVAVSGLHGKFAHAWMELKRGPEPVGERHVIVAGQTMEHPDIHYKIKRYLEVHCEKPPQQIHITYEKDYQKKL